jgi:hypothetical protein
MRDTGPVVEFSESAHRSSQPLKAMRNVATTPAVASAQQQKRTAITATNLVGECI